MDTIKAILRADKKTQEPILFFPEVTVNPGMILSYIRIGQHGEASLRYYWKNTIPLASSPLVPHYEKNYVCKLILKKRRSFKCL